MTIRLAFLILTASLALLATGSTAPAADGDAVGRWAQPAASQPDAEQAFGRWGRVQPNPPRWRPQGSIQPHPRGYGKNAH